MSEQQAEGIVTLEGTRVLVCAPAGPVLRDDQDVVDVIAQVYGEDVTLVALPVERLAPDFFRLASGVAGAVVQKFAQYGLRLAILGDVSAHVERSPAFRAFVAEANRGRQLWFVADDPALAARLAGRGVHSSSPKTDDATPDRSR